MNSENTTEQTSSSVAATPASSLTQELSPQKDADSQLPNYREIATRVMEGLKERKGILFKRVLFMIAPIMLGFVIVSISQYFAGPETESAESALSVTQGILIGIGGFLILFIGWPWALIVGRIFRTERLIWIDSFFDNVQLTSSQSWSIAKKLFWPSVLLQLSIFFRYYAPVILVTFITIIGGTMFFLQLNSEARPVLIVAIILLPLVGLVIYSYVLQVRLRYVWFVFLDLYGTPGYSRSAIYKRTKELNRQLKQEDFKKLMATTLAADATAGIANTGLNTATGLVGRLGGPAKTGAALVNMVGQTMVEVSKEYAKQVSYYMFYRLACKKLYGDDAVLSTSLYKNHTSNPSHG